MSSIQMIAAALAAALMVPAAAQSDQGAEKWRKGRAAATQPAPAQQPGQAQATGQWERTERPLTDEQRTAIGAIHARSQIAIQAADLAGSRAASPEVKGLASRFLTEYRRAEGELKDYLSVRQGGDPNALPAGPDRQRLEGEVAQLGAKSGEEFDREYVAFVTRNHPGFVDALKHARDVTPGKDSAFKKWLDGYENVEEEHLTAMRQLKAQRQARKPPAR